MDIKKNYQEALNLFSRALESDPEFHCCLYPIATLKYDYLGDTQGALKHLE